MRIERPGCGELCPLDAFVASQAESRERDWGMCGLLSPSTEAYAPWML